MHSKSGICTNPKTTLLQQAVEERRLGQECVRQHLVEQLLDICRFVKLVGRQILTQEAKLHSLLRIFHPIMDCLLSWYMEVNHLIHSLDIPHQYLRALIHLGVLHPVGNL